MTPARYVLLTGCLLGVGFCSGWAGDQLGVPLAWMICPMVVVGLATIALNLPQLPSLLRSAGQVIIGSAVGLYLTPEAFERIASNAVPILLGTLMITFVACVLSLMQIRWTGTDPATAIFSNVPGGPMDMAAMAERHGGNAAHTAASQTMRIATVVLLFPPLLILASAETFVPDVPYGNWSDTVILAVIAAAAASAFVRLRIINPYFLGPLIVVGALTAADFGLSSYHAGVVPAAQVLLGVTLGGMFQRSTFVNARSFIVALLATTGALLLASAIVAEILVLGFGGDFPVMMLANAPGGVAEMVITGQVLHLDVPLIASYQIVRIILGILLGSLFYKLYVRHLALPGKSDPP